MTTSNTEILIRRSLATNKPASLAQGELGFSYTSNALFIGTIDGDDAFEIAGYKDYSGNFYSGVGQYGSSTGVPVITVAANGQITAINTAPLSTTLNINSDAGLPSSVDLLSEVFTIAGGAGLFSSISGQTVTLDVDNTVLRTNTVIGLQTINGSVQVSGNLIVSGNVTSIDTQTLNVADPLIYLAANNYSSDIVDIGYVGNYYDGSTQRHAGVYRHASDKQFYIFDNYSTEPTNNLIDPTDPSFHLATLHTNLTAPTINVTTLYVTQNTTISENIFAPNIPNARTGNLVYFDTANGRFTYADDNALTPTSIANGSYSLSISSTDGLMTTNGAGLTLANGAKLKDTSSNAVAFGKYAGTLSQGADAVAIGDSAGYNSQGAYSVAIGYGAGNVNQNQVAVAIGLNAGLNAQGYNGIAIGNGAAASNQGTGAIALGYSTGSGSGNYSIAIGHEAGKGNTSFIGANALALGYRAGYETAYAGSIILNASGSNLSSTAAGLYINPVRYTASQDVDYDGIVFYNSNTKEIRYSYSLDGGSF
jgi:hypothetical protein